jgi:hypothetical protein
MKKPLKHVSSEFWFEDNDTRMALLVPLIERVTVEDSTYYYTSWEHLSTEEEINIE